jgi:Flp pilus assembly protein TadG
MITPSRGPDQRGSAALELVVVVPAIMLMLGLLLAGGRVWFVRATVTDAAESAARAASLARSPQQATLGARSVVDASLSDSDLHCTSVDVDVSTAAFAVPVGQPATITSEVTCVAAFGDIFLPGLPGSFTIRATARSALDTYRERR